MKKIAGWILLAALGAAFLAACMMVLEAFNYHGKILNGDLVYIESLYRDFFERSYPISGWLVSRAPYFFPDWAVFFALRETGADYSQSFALYMLFIVLFMTGFFACLARYLFGRLRFGDGVFILFWGLVLITASCFNIFPAPKGVTVPLEMLQLLAPTIHAGAAVCGLIVLGLWLRSLSRPAGKGMLAGLFLFATLASMSDQWWIIWFGVPIGLVALWFMARGELPWRRHLPFLVAMGAGVVASQGVVFLLQETSALYFSNVPIGETGSPALRHLGHLLADLGLMIAALPVFSLGIFLPAVALGALTLMRKREDRWFSPLPAAPISPERQLALKALHLVFLVSLLTTMTAIVIVKLWTYPNFRYLSSYVFGAWIIAGLFYFRHLRATEGWKSVLAYALPVAALVAALPVLMFVRPDIFDQLRREDGTFGLPRTSYGPHMLCVDELARREGLRYGLSEYAEAKPVTEFSRAGVQVHQVTYEFDILHWMNNYHWYQDVLDPKSGQPGYDFILSYPAGSAYQRVPFYFGEPDERVQCGSWQIMIFRGAKRERLNDFMRVKLVKFLESVGDEKAAALRPDMAREAVWQFMPLEANEIEALPADGAKQEAGARAVRWRLPEPATGATFEIRQDGAKTLRGRKFRLAFRARAPEGEVTADLQVAYVPEESSGQRMTMIAPERTDSYTLTPEWQTIVRDFAVPYEAGAGGGGDYLLVRPIVISAPGGKTIDIADVTLRVIDILPMPLALIRPVEN
ncbi:MAG: hypothetical protein GC131_06805 [Alphaproteobacteria bacterium]|nr:hypothetical protein [Alphaproteobacteria bacterium]